MVICKPRKQLLPLHVYRFICSKLRCIITNIHNFFSFNCNHSCTRIQRISSPYFCIHIYPIYLFFTTGNKQQRNKQQLQEIFHLLVFDTKIINLFTHNTFKIANRLCHAHQRISHVFFILYTAYPSVIYLSKCCYQC